MYRPYLQVCACGVHVLVCVCTSPVYIPNNWIFWNVSVSHHLPCRPVVWWFEAESGPGPIPQTDAPSPSLISPLSVASLFAPDSPPHTALRTSFPTRQDIHQHQLPPAPNRSEKKKPSEKERNLLISRNITGKSNVASSKHNSSSPSY